MTSNTKTIVESPPEINPQRYNVPKSVRCKKHGLVAPVARGQVDKRGNDRMGVYCSKCEAFVQWIAKKAKFYTPKEIAHALKYIPGQQSYAGLPVPEPKFTKTVFQHRCLGCGGPKGKWAVLGWNKSAEPIRAIICSYCKKSLTDWYAKKRAERRSREPLQPR